MIFSLCSSARSWQLVITFDLREFAKQSAAAHTLGEFSTVPPVDLLRPSSDTQDNNSFGMTELLRSSRIASYSCHLTGQAWLRTTERAQSVRSRLSDPFKVFT
jgi:hypothetical protein